MLWNVNNGGGYPYPNGTDIASYVSSSDFKLLDTNGDGSITQADDPYAPYYPVSLTRYIVPQWCSMLCYLIFTQRSLANMS